MNKFLRTDLATESIPCSKKISTKDYEIKPFILKGFEVIMVEIKSKEAERISQREIGKYYTIVIGRIWQKNKEASNAKDTISEIFKELLDKKEKILIVGLGNKDITPDSFGPLCIENLRKLSSEKSTESSIYMLTPGVFAQTQINLLDLIKATIDITNATTLVLIDSLASRSVDRLCSTIQISNAGISPGSGIGYAQEKICEEAVGVPVISIGVPTVVSASTLVCDALSILGLKKSPSTLNTLLTQGIDFFVSPNDIDAVVSSLSRLVSEAIFDALK